MPSRPRPRSESNSKKSSQLPGVMESRRRRRRGGSRRRRRRSSTQEDPQQDEVRSHGSGASSRSASIEPEARSHAPISSRSCHLGNVNPYINFVASSKGLYTGRPFRSMAKGIAARWRALPEAEREPFIVQARRSRAEIAKTVAAEGRIVPEARRRRRRRGGRRRR